MTRKLVIAALWFFLVSDLVFALFNAPLRMPPWFYHVGDALTALVFLTIVAHAWPTS